MSDDDGFGEIGCRKCGSGAWRVKTDGKRFKAMCAACGHTVDVPAPKVTDRPDVEAFDMRMFL